MKKGMYGVKIACIKNPLMIKHKIRIVFSITLFMFLFTIPNLLSLKIFDQASDYNHFNWNLYTPSAADSSLFTNEGELIQIGQSLNLTHYANRTDSGVELAFKNGSWDAHNILLGEDWRGESLDVQVSSLTDERNWVNGSFDWDEQDDGSYNQLENDTLEIQNPFQNWTFQVSDQHHIATFYTNNMSGNYINSSNPSTGRNALELRLNGDLNDTGSGGGYGYDEHDYCQWITEFNIPRGIVYDGSLDFQVKANKTMQMSMFQLRFYFDGKLFNSMYPANLLSLGPGWHDFSIPMSAWINSSVLFPTQLNGYTHNFTIRLEYTSGTGTQYDFPNRQYQQIFIANPELIIKSEVKPQQINLTMNEVSLSSSQYGTGEAVQSNSWLGSVVTANFTATNNASFGIAFIANLNAHALKITPTTNFEASSDAIGAKFVTKNNSDSVWEFYTYVSVPSGYEETNLTINHPGDWIITWVSSPQVPNTNRVDDCFRNLSNLSIPVKFISGAQNPTGFWTIKATTPNYVFQATTARNTTTVPGNGDWTNCLNFTAGDYLNVTAQINITAAFTSVSDTQACLDIIFPNGTLWITRTALATVDTLGLVQFTPFRIPTSGGDYVAGDYSVFVTWNNSKAEQPLNETGLYLTKFHVIHAARLIPKVSVIENFVEGSKTVLKMEFTDEVTGRAIQGAKLSFANFTGGIQTFQEDPSGFYMAELIAPSSAIGEHTIMIHATHQDFESQSIPLTVIVVPRPIEIQWWLFLLLAAAVVGILVTFVAYQRVYRFPKLVRDIRAVKNGIGRGQIIAMPVKPLSALLAQEYQSQIKEGQGVVKHVSVDSLFATCQQEISQVKIIRPAPAFEKVTPQPGQAEVSGVRPPVAASPQESTSQRARLDQLKNMIAQVENYKKQVAENEKVKAQIGEYEKRLHDLEKVAVPMDQLRGKIQDLENKLNVQKVPLRQLQEENQQQQAIQAAADKLPDLQAKVKALEQEVTQAKQVRAAVPAPADLPQLAQELQQKLNQTQLALRNRQARIKDLEMKLGQA